MSDAGDAVEAGDACFLGIDVGGTYVKLGLVDGGGRMLDRGSASTPQLKTPANVFQYAMDFAATHLPKRNGASPQLGGVGLAVPGVLDTREHVLREVVNLPGWHGEPLMQILRRVSHLPSAVVNDANAAAYAEHTLRDLGDRSLALVTLGTGIGCGLVVGGDPFGGDHGCAGELGHIAIRFDEDALPCTCGSRGHLESYAGSGGLIARLRSALQATRIETVPEVLLQPQVSPRDIADEAERGFEICQHLIQETATYVGQAVGMLGQVIDPEVVLLGGAMTFGGSASETGQQFLRGVRETVRRTTLVQVGTKMVIDFASLGNDAGVLGAAMVAKQAYQQ